MTDEQNMSMDQVEFMKRMKAIASDLWGGTAALVGEGKEEAPEKKRESAPKAGGKPVMISPWLSILPDAPRGAGGHIPEWRMPPMDFDAFRKEWDGLFGHIAGAVDIVAFQDGYVPYPYFREICQIMKELGDAHGITIWINSESFDRDMPFRFPPINWQTFRYKLETAASAGIREAITFEYSHFMSPNSMWPSAAMLRDRYMEWQAEQ